MIKYSSEGNDQCGLALSAHSAPGGTDDTFKLIPT